jgi:hypothetical protein
MSSKRFGGGGGQLPAEVRLGKDTKADAGAAKVVEAMAQTPFVTDATDDEGRVLGIRRKECPCGFQTGVAGLNDLLRMGEITADQHVDAGPLFDLPEIHEKPPLRKTRRLRPAGVEPATPSFRD